jgi:hypothetical protein
VTIGLNCYLSACCAPFHPDEEAEIGLDLAVHGEAATAIEGIVNEIANNFHTSFFGEMTSSERNCVVHFGLADLA